VGDVIETRHREHLERIAREYRDAGFDVDLQPPREALPPGVPYLPDLVAVRGDEKVVVDLKLAHRSRDLEQWSELASALERHGWKFRLIVIGADEAPVIDYSSAQLDEIVAKLGKADELAATSIDAALLLAWAGFEAAARRALLLRERSLVRPTTSVALAKQLVHHGLLDQDELESLTPIAARRNAVAHGATASDVTPSDVERLTSLGRELLDAA
jgi:hypothetical protein